MSLENVRIVEIITTAYEEENFILLTDLSDEQIENVIRPIVEKERNAEDSDDDSYYDNEGLFNALEQEYPENVVIFYSDKSFDEITI
jgi:hypothetical protein